MVGGLPPQARLYSVWPHSLSLSLSRALPNSACHRLTNLTPLIKQNLVKGRQERETTLHVIALQVSILAPSRVRVLQGFRACDNVPLTFQLFKGRLGLRNAIRPQRRAETEIFGMRANKFCGRKAFQKRLNTSYAAVCDHVKCVLEGLFRRCSPRKGHPRFHRVLDISFDGAGSINCVCLLHEPSTAKATSKPKLQSAGLQKATRHLKHVKSLREPTQRQLHAGTYSVHTHSLYMLLPWYGWACRYGGMHWAVFRALLSQHQVKIVTHVPVVPRAAAHRW